MKILSSAGTAISREVCWEEKMCLCKPYVEYELSIKLASDRKYLLSSITLYYSTKVTIQVTATEACTYQSRECFFQPLRHTYPSQAVTVLQTNLSSFFTILQMKQNLHPSTSSADPFSANLYRNTVCNICIQFLFSLHKKAALNILLITVLLTRHQTLS
jgi:hypothetical protein